MRPNYDRSRQVARWMIERPGTVTHYADVAEALDMPKNLVNAALSRMAKMPQYRINHGDVAGYYVYRPNAVTEPAEVSREIPEMFELVGITQSGTKVVKSEKGILYTLSTEL